MPYWRSFNINNIHAADLAAAIGGCAAASMAGWLFYNHLAACVILAPSGLLLVPFLNAVRSNRRHRIMQLEFSRFLQSLISSLYAGQSLETAFREIEKDMRKEAWRESNMLLPALSRLNQRINLGEPIEKVLVDTAADWGLEDMKVFAETLAVFRRSGGNLLLHLRRTAELIMEKIEAEQEMQVILAKKRMEAVMMNIAPYLMIGLIILGSPDYAAPLYSGSGRLVMTVSLLLIASGHVWTYRMLRRNRL